MQRNFEPNKLPLASRNHSEPHEWHRQWLVNTSRQGRTYFPEVLGLYRKRPLRGSVNHIGVGGRFRYSDLKEAAGYGI